MNLPKRLRSILATVLLLVFVVVLAQLLGVKAIAQSQDRIEEIVTRLLSVPVFTASDERQLNEAGDEAAVAITKTISAQEMNSPETARRVLLILHLAFEAPQSINDPDNKTPRMALHLLEQLERTEYGRQPNVVSNARFEVTHNTSTGRPLELVTLHGEPVLDWGHSQWVGSVIAWIATIKPGMTRSDLLRVFTTEGGLSARTHRTYVLKQCPTIKVDVEFSISRNEAEDRITQISKPYLDYSHYD